MAGVIIPVADNNALEDAHLAVDAGITQLSGASLAASSTVLVTIRAQVNGSNLTLPRLARPVFFSIALEATSGNDRYWDHEGRTWVDYGSAFPANYFDPNSGNFARGILSREYLHPSIPTNIEANIPSTPATGSLRISLYNVVETQDLASEEITGVTYWRVGLSVTSDTDTDAQSTTTDAYDETNTTDSRPEVVFWTGDGPTEFHKGRITYSSGTRATGWQTGAYSGGASSGLSLDRHHAETILNARYQPLRRLRIPVRVTSGTLWPHQPILFDSVYYSAVQMEHHVRSCEYMVEATEVRADSPTVTEEETPRLHLPAVLGPLSVKEKSYVPGIGRAPLLPRTSHVSVGEGSLVGIQAAIDALGGQGGTVRIPEGTYTITTAISIPSNVTIEGSGWGTIIDVNTGDDDYGFYLQKGTEGSRDTSTNTSNVVIRDLTLQGRVDTLYHHEHTHLLNLNGACDVVVENVQFKNWRGDAIYLGSGNVGHKSFTADAGTDVLSSTAHGFAADSRVVVWSTSDATTMRYDPSGDLPAGLYPSPLYDTANGKEYFVINSNTNDLQLSLTSGGAAVDITDAGTGTHYIGTERHNERITIRNCYFDGGSTDKEHKAYRSDGSAVSVTATASTDKINHTGHSYAEGNAIRFAGSTGAGLTDGTTYYVRDVETNAYKLSTTIGGAAINLTGDVSSGMTIPVDTVNNRQAISIIDGTAIKIQGNTFTNSGAANMPGVIDIEPDRAVYHIIDDISITDNTIHDTGGNIGAICGALQYWGDSFQQPRNIKVRGNVIRNSVPTGVMFLRSDAATTSHEPLGITISDNHIDAVTGISTGQAGRPFGLLGITGAVVSGNHFQHTMGGAVVGQTVSAAGDRQCYDVTIANNIFYQCGHIPYASDTGAYDDLFNCGLYIGYVERLNVLGNTFYDCGDENDADGESMEFAGGVGSTIVAGNHFIGSSRTIDVIKETGASLGTGAVTASAAADTLTYTAHPFQDGDRFRISTSNTLPAPLEANTTYYVRDAATNTFKAAATLGGAAINLTDAGTGTHTVRPVGWHRFGDNVVRGITGDNEFADNAAVNKSLDDPEQSVIANDYIAKSNINTTSGVVIVQGNAVVGARQSAITSPSGGATIDAEARTAIDAIRAALAAHGLTS